MNNCDSSFIVSIFIGVISGVITSILIWFIVKFFQNTIIPWYQNLIYRGQSISGDWEGFGEVLNKKDGKGMIKRCSVINLEQKGNSIKGTLTLIKQPSGNNCNKVYKLNGYFYSNCLVLTYEVLDKTKFGLGSCVFKLVNDGQKLDGYWTAINTLQSSDVFSSTEYWLRKK